MSIGASLVVAVWAAILLGAGTAMVSPSLLAAICDGAAIHDPPWAERADERTMGRWMQALAGRPHGKRFWW